MKRVGIMLTALVMLLVILGCEETTKPEGGEAVTVKKEKRIINYAKMDKPTKALKKADDIKSQGVFYQIFLLSFYDSDGDGKGDLNGLIKKLDYLADLGITGIWLCPIFDSFQYHGYDTTDYYNIKKDYGTMKDFENLVKEAKKRGIAIVLDLVINHTSKRHPWFIDSANNPDSPYKDWYIWSEKDLNKDGWQNASGARQPAWNSYLDDKASYRYNQFYYAAFNGTIPDLNLQNEAVVEEMLKIGRFWLEKGVAGYRLDGARFMIEDGAGRQADTESTIQFWNSFCTALREEYPDAYIIAEIFAGMEMAKKYYTGESGLTAAFNFEFGADSTINMGLGGMPKSLDGFKKKVAELINHIKGGLPHYFLSIFLSNHDKGRFAEMVRDIDKMKLGAVIQFTLPGGPPYIYYGDEIGQRDGDNAIGDAHKRNPMWWNAGKNAGFTTKDKPWCMKMVKDIKFYTNGVNVEEELKRSDSILSLYKRLIQMRKSYACLQSGDTTVVTIKDNGDKFIGSVMSYVREDKNHVALVIFNASKVNIVIDQVIDASAIQKNIGKLKLVDCIYSQDIQKTIDQSVADAILKEGKWKIDLDPKDFVVAILEK